MAATLMAHGADEFQSYKVDKNTKVPTAPPEAREAWKDERFGMFVHWGPISQMGRQLSHSRNSPSHRPGGKPYKVADIPPEVYDVQYKTFNPVKFDPDAMVKMAKAAGVRYVVFTAKHHAGFSMFDSAFTDYDMASTPYKKDIVKLIADACAANGLHFGFYYSPRDWHHPDCDSEKHHDRYIRFYENQMKELLTKYGPIYEVWFDGLGPGGPKGWGNTSVEVMSMIRKLQPNAMVNDRGGVGADFYTPEHYISFYNDKDCWEACHTTTGQWGYNPKVHTKKLSQLMEILLYCWGGDGNVLLNIGPRGDGSINPEEAERFAQLADWWKTHGEQSIRKTRGGPYLPGPWGVSTRRDDRVFLHVFHWPESGTLSFPALDGVVPVSARLVATGKPVKLEKRDGGFSIAVPSGEREEIVTSIELKFGKPVMNIKARYRVPSLVMKAKLGAPVASDQLDQLRDQNARTSWSVKLAKNAGPLWIEAKFDEPVTIGSFAVQRGVHDWNARSNAQLQIPDGQGGWKTVSEKKSRLRFTTMKFLPEPVETDRVRLLIDSPKRFGCAEFELFPPVK